MPHGVNVQRAGDAIKQIGLFWLIADRAPSPAPFATGPVIQAG
jgi:hypothetical protein